MDVVTVMLIDCNSFGDIPHVFVGKTEEEATQKMRDYLVHECDFDPSDIDEQMGDFYLQAEYEKHTL